jgi:hypothetical protein
VTALTRFPKYRVIALEYYRWSLRQVVGQRVTVIATHQTAAPFWSESALKAGCREAA